MKWIKAIMELYCLFQGFQVKKLTTKKELKTAFDLKNKVNKNLTGLAAVPQEDEFVYPKGIAHFIGVFKKGQLIGSIQLLDLTQIQSYTSKIYANANANANLDYNPQTTYEVKSFVVDNEFQHGIGGVFNVLVFYAIYYSEISNIDKWLVVTSTKFYEKIKKRSGLPSSLISQKYHYEKDNTPQSRYFRNYIEQDHLKDCTCYYIHIPKGILIGLTFKFLKISMLKTLKRVNPFRFQKRKIAPAKA
jgi:hypothetical protein